MLQAPTILCDFDGTIAIEDVTDAVLAALAHPSWVEIEEAWQAGRIDARTCMALQVQLIEGDWRDIARIADAATVAPGFERFAAWCAAHGARLVVASDGLDFCIARVLGRIGLAGLPVRANRLLRDPGGTWRLENPFARPGCDAGHCKCSSLAGSGPTIVIGDGRSDMCAAANADFVFAKHSLLRFCREQCLPHQPFLNFEDVIGGLERVQARGLPGRGRKKDVA